MTFFLIELSTTQGQTFYFENGDTLTVISKSGANLRDSNSIKSTIINSIPFGEKVIARPTECYVHFVTDSFDNRYGSWINVEYGGKEGCMFSGFLTKLKLPNFDFESIICYAQDYLKT